MKRLSIWSWLLLGLLSAPALAATTYTYSGANFTSFSGAYSASSRVTGSFTLAAPLAASLPNTDIRSLILSYSFSDGVQTRNETNSEICAVSIYGFRVSTDASGNIATWAITLCSPVAAAGDPVTGVFTIRDIGVTDTVEDLGVSGTCGELSGGACSSIGVATSGTIYSNSPLSWSREVGPVASSVEIPTLSDWSLAALAAMMLAWGAVLARRRSATQR